VPTPRLPMASQKATAISRSMDNLRSHKGAETAPYGHINRAIRVITTPTKSRSRSLKPIYCYYYCDFFYLRIIPSVAIQCFYKILHYFVLQEAECTTSWPLPPSSTFLLQSHPIPLVKALANYKLLNYMRQVIR